MVDGHNLNDVANVFNTFFTTVTAKLVEKQSPPQMYFYSFPTVLQQHFSDSLPVDIRPASDHFIYKKLFHLNTLKGT